MSPLPPLPPLPGTSYLRLSDTHLHFVRYEAGAEGLFAFEAFDLKPQLSLAANLREMRRGVAEMQSVNGGLHLVVSGPVTPVPLSEFQEEDCEALFTQCFPEREKRRIFYEVIGTLSIVLLFSLEEATCRTLEEAFGEILYQSAVTPLLRHFSRKAVPGDGHKRVVIYPHDTCTDIIIFDELRLMAVNSFATTEPADIAYFALGLAHQLSLTVLPESHTAEEKGCVTMRPGNCTTLYVAGEQALRDRTCDELRQYAADVVPIRPSGEYNRHRVAATPDLPYDLVTLLLDA